MNLIFTCSQNENKESYLTLKYECCWGYKGFVVHKNSIVKVTAFP